MMYPLIDSLMWFKDEYPKAIKKFSNYYNQSCYNSIFNNYNKLYNHEDCYYMPPPPCNNMINNKFNPALDANIKNSNEKFAKCNHMDMYGIDAVVQIDKNTAKCQVCGATWDCNPYSYEQVNKAVETLLAAIQSVKWINNQYYDSDMFDNHGYKGDKVSTSYPDYNPPKLPVYKSSMQPPVDIKIGGMKHGENSGNKEE